MLILLLGAGKEDEASESHMKKIAFTYTNMRQNTRRQRLSNKKKEKTLVHVDDIKHL